MSVMMLVRMSVVAEIFAVVAAAAAAELQQLLSEGSGGDGCSADVADAEGDRHLFYCWLSVHRVQRCTPCFFQRSC